MPGRPKSPEKIAKNAPRFRERDGIGAPRHERIAFGYEHARVTRSASEAYEERRGVCRDYAHLAIAFCRALNIPARYCTGYLGDVRTPPPHAAYLEGDLEAHF